MSGYQIPATFSPDKSPFRTCNGCAFRYHEDNARCAWCGLPIQRSQPVITDAGFSPSHIRRQSLRVELLAKYPLLNMLRAAKEYESRGPVAGEPLCS